MSGRFAVFGFVLSLVFALGVVAAPAQASQATAKKYQNCSGLLKVQPAGVAKSAKARNQAVQEGFKRPAVSEALYEVNGSRLDRDKDGVMCEQRA